MDVKKERREGGRKEGGKREEEGREGRERGKEGKRGCRIVTQENNVVDEWRGLWYPCPHEPENGE